MGRVLLVLLALLAPSVKAANLDVSASYRMRALAYTNLNLNTSDKNSHSFISNDARLELAVRKIYLETFGGEDTTLDVGIGLHALGVAGSTTAFQPPFLKIAQHYPSSDFTPFFEKAYLAVHQLFGVPWDMTFGRQSYRLASGLLLDDDGAGLTGGSIRGELPWWGMKLEGFLFSARNSQTGPNNLTLYGVTLDVPSEGLWQFSQLIEHDRKSQTIFGCAYPGMPADGCVAANASRLFSSARYQINYGPIIFDGEAAMQRGTAKLQSPLAGAPDHITFDGNAQVLKAKWKQRLYRTGEGIARLSIARGSGDDPGTLMVDEAFFPSHGHRYSGMERSGFGDFFGATPYDAFGGSSASTSTASGLKPGASGIIAVGVGFTPPAYKGVALDIDYFLYQAERIQRGKRTLGAEWDFRLRYNIKDQFSLSASAALFGVGTASNPALGRSRKYTFEVNGRF